MNFLKQYGDTEGPLGIPMKDRQAKALEQILKALPAEDRVLSHLVVTKAPAWHNLRAQLCGVPVDEIDHEFHLRSGAGERCD
jgi:hypothetical protein